MERALDSSSEAARTLSTMSSMRSLEELREATADAGEVPADTPSISLEEREAVKATPSGGPILEPEAS